MIVITRHMTLARLVEEFKTTDDPNHAIGVFNEYRSFVSEIIEKSIPKSDQEYWFTIRQKFRDELGYIMSTRLAKLIAEDIVARAASVKTHRIHADA